MRCRDPAPGEPPLHPRRRLLADCRVGLARLVRVRHRPRPVHSRLQPYARRRQQIVVGLTEALVEQRRHRLVEGEVRRGLASRRIVVHARGLAPTHRPSRRRHSHAVRRPRPSRPRPRWTSTRVRSRSLRAGRGSCTEQRLQREVGVHDPAVGLEEPGLAVVQSDREASPGLGPVQHLERHAACGQRIPVACQSPRSIVPGWSSSARPQPDSSSCQSGYASCASRTQRSSG